MASSSPNKEVRNKANRNGVAVRPGFHWNTSEWTTRLTHRYPVVFILVAYVAGLAIAHALPLAALTPVVIVGLVLCLAAVFAFAVKFTALSVGLGALALCGVATVHGLTSRPATSDALSQFASRESKPIAIRAVVTSMAVWRPDINQRFARSTGEEWRSTWDLRCLQVRDGNQWLDIDAYTDLSMPGRVQDLLPGDEIQVFGNIRNIAPPSNPGEFDFATQASLDGRYSRISADDRSQVQIQGKQHRYFLSRLRAQTVTQIDRLLRRWVSFDQAALAAALVFGQREQVDWSEQQELMATGTLHLLAISGMHVGILAVAIIAACNVLSLSTRAEFWLIVILCGLYATLAGGKPPVLRAVVLISLLALARASGRKSRLSNILSVAALLLLAMRAANLENMGVHLSFLAVASIGVFAFDQTRAAQRRSALQNVIEESYSGWYRTLLLVLRSTRESIQLSFWVWLITCPLIWTSFHVISPIAVALNVIVSVPLTISLLSGLTTGLLGWIAPVGWLAGQITGTCLALIGAIISLGDSLPLGHFWLPSPPLWWTIVFYGATALWLLLFHRKYRFWLATSLLLWLAIGMGLYRSGPRGFAADSPPNADVSADHSDLRCTFVDVGHGTSVILEMPTGEVWLYDAGNMSAMETSHQNIATALWHLPTARVDTCFISHADSDHYSAVRGLAERFRIGRFISTQRFWDTEQPEIRKIVSLANSKRVPIETAFAGMAGDVGDVHWQVLHPRKEASSESDNADSLCLLLEYADVRVLLPGDLEGTGMLDLVELPKRPCHLLMAPHHGSLSQDPEPIMRWCQPDVLVVSGNHRAAREAVVNRFSEYCSQVAVTFRDGAIQVRVNPDGEISLWHWSEQAWKAFVPPNPAPTQDN